MTIEGRQRPVFGHEAVDARRAREEGMERARRAEQNPPPALADQPRVADELKGIAQPLLGPHEKGLAFEQAAVPAGLRAAQFLEAGRAPAPFVFDPAAAKVSGGQPGQGAVQVRFGVVGFVPQRPFIRSQGLGDATALEQNHAEVVVGLGIVGLQGQRAPQAAFGFVEIAQLAQGVAEIVVRLGVSGVELRCPPERGDGSFKRFWILDFGYFGFWIVGFILRQLTTSRWPLATSH